MNILSSIIAAYLKCKSFYLIIASINVIQMSKYREKDALNLFLGRLSSEVKYAIERNVESAFIPLVGDIDMLIDKKSYLLLLKIASELEMLISVTEAYGGARIFIGSNVETIKRIDCVWRLHYRGIKLMEIEEVLERRVIDAETGLYILPEESQVQIIWAIKNAYGGIVKYLPLLKSYGCAVLNSYERRLWLCKLIVRYPLSFAVGLVAYAMTYVKRIFYPTGLLVFGVSVENLQSSPAVCYLFQDRVRIYKSTAQSIFRGRLLSEICVVPYSRLAQLIISPDVSIKDMECEIFNYLRSNHKDYA